MDTAFMSNYMDILNESALRESVNDYDGMNWLRDILFEHY